MLKTTLTKNYGAIEIWGTGDDILELYDFVHRVAESDAPLKGKAGDWVLGLAYEARKARENQRQIDVVKDLNENLVTYYGFNMALPYWIIYIGVLRCCVGWVRSEKDQAMMYQLEALTRVALSHELSANTVDNILAQSTSFFPTFIDGVIEPAYRASAYYLSLTKMKRIRNLLPIVQSLHPIMLDVRPSPDVELWPDSEGEAAVMWDQAKM